MNESENWYTYYYSLIYPIVLTDISSLNNFSKNVILTERHHKNHKFSLGSWRYGWVSKLTTEARAYYYWLIHLISDQVCERAKAW